MIKLFLVLALMFPAVALAEETPKQGLTAFFRAGNKAQISSFCGRIENSILKSQYRGMSKCLTYWLGKGGTPLTKSFKITKVKYLALNAALVTVKLNGEWFHFWLVKENRKWKIAADVCFNCTPGVTLHGRSA